MPSYAASVSSLSSLSSSSSDRSNHSTSYSTRSSTSPSKYYDTKKLKPLSFAPDPAERFLPRDPNAIIIEIEPRRRDRVRDWVSSSGGSSVSGSRYSG
ncbi:hypothetical protein MMC10_010039 [Thelotrema lepadinum]|nr:hypothetical protein [Thelotrema lepadinum]